MIYATHYENIMHKFPDIWYYQEMAETKSGVVLIHMHTGTTFIYTVNAPLIAIIIL